MSARVKKTLKATYRGESCSGHKYSSTTKRCSDLNLNIVNIITVKRSFFPGTVNMDLDLSVLSHMVIGEGQMKFPWKLMLRLFGLQWLIWICFLLTVNHFFFFFLKLCKSSTSKSCLVRGKIFLKKKKHFQGFSCVLEKCS